MFMLVTLVNIMIIIRMYMCIYYVLLPAVCTLLYSLQFKELYLIRAAYKGNLYFQKPKFYLLLLIRIQT